MKKEIKTTGNYSEFGSKADDKDIKSMAKKTKEKKEWTMTCILCKGKGVVEYVGKLGRYQCPRCGGYSWKYLDVNFGNKINYEKV